MTDKAIVYPKKVKKLLTWALAKRIFVRFLGNGIVTAPPLVLRFGIRSDRSVTRILPAMVLLRKPLFGLAKRQLPRTLCAIVPKE